MADVVWDGITRRATLTPEAAKVRDALADAAHAYQWDQVLDILAAHPHLANTTRLDGTSRFAPLHQAAHAGAPANIVDRLVRRGAWRCLQNARGERPVDVAARTGHADLVPHLQPRLLREVPHGVLLRIQTLLHDLVRERAGNLVDEHCLRLPELEILLELAEPALWFPIPGMYGGFNLRLTRDGVQASLTTESWCRVVGGSGQRHEITSKDLTLLEEGFV